MFRHTIPMQAIFFEPQDLERILKCLRHEKEGHNNDDNDDLIEFIEGYLKAQGVA